MLEVGTVLDTNDKDFGNILITVCAFSSLANAWLYDAEVYNISEQIFHDFDAEWTWDKFLWVLEWVKKNFLKKDDSVKAFEVIKNTNMKDFTEKCQQFRLYFILDHEPSDEERIACSIILGPIVYEGRRIYNALNESYNDIIILWKRQRMCAFLLLARRSKTGRERNLFTLLQAKEIVKKIADYCYND